jgi:hypothetical protein
LIYDHAKACLQVAQTRRLLIRAHQGVHRGDRHQDHRDRRDHQDHWVHLRHRDELGDS